MTKLNTQSADEFFRQVDILEAKLDKIKEIAKENNICEGFGCIPMYKILKVIEGAEDE